MDKSRVKFYLSEWGRLKRLAWNPQIGYRYPSHSEEAESGIDEGFAEKVFAAVGYVKLYSPKTYQVLKLTYECQLKESVVAEKLGFSKRRVLEYLREGQNLVQYFLLGSAA